MGSKAWGAMKNWFRRQDAAAAEAMADPVGDAQLAIEDSKKQISGFQTQIAKFMATQKRQERELVEAKAKVKRYLNLAKKAAAEGNEEDARAFLTQKATAQQSVDTLKVQDAENVKAITDLKAKLKKHRDRVSKAQSDSARLAAQLEGAKVRKELAKASADFDSDSPLSKLDDLSKRVDQESAEAASWEELSGQAGEIADLEEKYGSTGDAAVDDELAALMAGAKKDK